MSNPPMPSLYGQITETIKANLKIFLIFSFLLALATNFLNTPIIEHLAEQMLIFKETGKAPTMFSSETLPYLLLLITFSLYLCYQTMIISTDYHQQPPNQPRTILWFTDKGFHQHFWRYTWHHFLIGLLWIVIGGLIMLLLSIVSKLQNNSLNLILSISLFVIMIAYIPLTATKLPAVIDPNGDTSFKAALHRGKYIFWPYLGNLILLIFAISIVGALITAPISSVLLSTFTNEIIEAEYGLIILSDDASIMAYIMFYIYYTLEMMVNTILYSALAVLASHYYIWSEYYLPSEKENTESE